PADILLPGPALFAAAAALGLTPADNVDALETVANPCPLAVILDLADSDGVGECDNCPATFNPCQEDTDADGVGDACDPCTDTDEDGSGNPGFRANVCPTDDCPSLANAAQTDLDV